MCCPGGGGGSRPIWGGQWGEVEPGERQRDLPLGEKGCDCSRPCNCHILSMRNIKEQREREKGWEDPHHLPCPIRHTGLRGWMEERDVIGWTGDGGGLTVTATQQREQETGMHEKFCLTLSVEKDISFWWGVLWSLADVPCVKTHNDGS